MTKTAPKHLTVVEFLTAAFAESGNTLDEISAGIGCEHSVMLSAVLRGAVKLPVHYVYPIAKYLEIDPALFLRIYIRDYLPEVEQAIHDCQGTAVVTKRELSLLEAFRKATGDGDPLVVTFEDRRMVALALPD